MKFPRTPTLDLKPCPFCGYPATQVGDGVIGQLAHCSNEKCPIRNIMFYWAHWNIRPLDGSAAAPQSAGRSNALRREAIADVILEWDDGKISLDSAITKIQSIPEPTTEDPQ